MVCDLQHWVDDLAARIMRRRQAGGTTFLVAIDGRSGAGKTTLASALAEKLDAALLSGDDFYMGGTDLRQDSVEVLASDCIDWRKQRSVLKQLSQGRPASFYPFDWDAFDGSLSDRPIVVEPRDVIILEGVYAARPELRDLIDFAVLLSVPDTLRLQRLENREGEINAWERQWHRAEDWYFGRVVQVDDFDVILTPEAISDIR